MRSFFSRDSDYSCGFVGQNDWRQLQSFSAFKFTVGKSISPLCLSQRIRIWLGKYGNGVPTTTSGIELCSMARFELYSVFLDLVPESASLTALLQRVAGGQPSTGRERYCHLRIDTWWSSHHSLLIQWMSLYINCYTSLHLFLLII